MLGFVSALSLLIGGAQPCQAVLPHGSAVPAPIVIRTDCGWFRLATDGEVTRLPGNWLAAHTRPSRPHYTIGRTRAGRYLVVWQGEIVWRSRGLYPNEAGNSAFGPHSFAFDSWGRQAVFVTDLRGPERLVFRGRFSYPLAFTEDGQLLLAGRRTITVLAGDGTVLRTLRYRRSSSFAFDEATKTVYFVTPGAVLTAAHGSAVRRIAAIRERGWIRLLEQGLLSFTARRHVAIVRRDDGSLVASASWGGRRRELAGGIAVSDDGRLFAYRVARSPGPASVYLLRAGQHRARPVYRHHFELKGCGLNVTLQARGSAFLYESDVGRGVAQTAVLTANGAVTRLNPVLRALPRKTRTMATDAYWEADFTR